jgi:hypothetical protein
VHDRHQRVQRDGRVCPALGFPQAITTELYPEWPLASLAHVPREIQKIIAVPLLTLAKDSPEALAGDFASFAFLVRASAPDVPAIYKEGTGQCDPDLQRVGIYSGICVSCMPGLFGACLSCKLDKFNNGTGNTDYYFFHGELTTLAVGGVEGDCVPEPSTLAVCIATVDSAVGAVLLVLLVLDVRRFVRQALPPARRGGTGGRGAGA